MLLKARNLSLRRGDRTLFEGLHFEVRPGEFWVIEGASGIGKTSLFRVLSGELRPDQGAVERPQGCAEIPQDLALNEELSAVENACLGALKGQPPWRTILGVPSGLARQARTLLREWGLAHPDQRLGELSGGERQRVAWVRAHLENWRVLLADEPVSSLDETHARRLLEAMRDEAARRNGAVVAVLHHRGLIEEFATRRLDLSAPKAGNR